MVWFFLPPTKNSTRGPLAPIIKLFGLRFKKTLFLAKPRFEKYRPRLNILEHQLLKPQVKFTKPTLNLGLLFVIPAIVARPQYYQ